MPAGANQKREKEFKKLEKDFRQSGRYRGREEEVAARIVNKQRASFGETGNDKDKERQGKSPDRGLPIAHYQTLTIARIKAQLEPLSSAQLKLLRDYEARHKNRKGLLQLLDRRLEDT